MSLRDDNGVDDDEQQWQETMDQTLSLQIYPKSENLTFHHPQNGTIISFIDIIRMFSIGMNNGIGTPL
jgi:hypothetical protein